MLQNNILNKPKIIEKPKNSQFTQYPNYFEPMNFNNDNNKKFDDLKAYHKNIILPKLKENKRKEENYKEFAMAKELENLIYKKKNKTISAQFEEYLNNISKDHNIIGLEIIEPQKKRNNPTASKRFSIMKKPNPSKPKEVINKKNDRKLENKGKKIIIIS